MLLTRLTLSILTSLSPVADAHTPHDATVYTAVDPLSADAVITGFGRQRVWYGLRSEDGGWTWDAALIEGWASGVRSAAWFEGGLVALATDGGGLLLGDGASDGTPAPGVPTDAVLAVVRAEPGGGGGLAAGEGVFRSDDGGETWAEVDAGQSGAIVDLEWSPAAPGAACLITVTGEVRCSDDGGATWAARTQLPPGALDLDIAADGTIYVAAGASGLLIVDEDAAPLEADWVGAVEILQDGAVLVAGEEAVWRSDGGDFELATEGLEVPGEGRGGPPDQGRYYRFAEGPGGELLLAAWEGLHRSDDGGLSWVQLPLVAPSYHVRVQVLIGPDGPWIALPSYGGGGLSRVDLDGDWEVLSAANLGGYLRGAALSPDYDEDGVAWTAERGNLWGTTDGGASWLDHTLDGTLDYVENVSVQQGEGAPAALAAGFYGEAVDIAWTLDGGATWNRPGLAESAEPKYILDQAISPGFDGSGSLFVSGQGPVLLGSRDGAPFEIVQRPEVELLRLVFSSEETLWAASPDGLWKGPAHEPLAPHAFSGQLVTDVAFSPDGQTAFAALATDGGQIARSEDGGDTWVLLPESPQGALLDLDVSPDFAADGVVAVATFGGVWASTDRGETWTLASNRLSVDVSHQLWSTSGDEDWKVVGEVEGAFLRSGADALAAGATATLDFEGEAISLTALCGETQGAIEIAVDGGEPRRIELGGDVGFEVVYCEEELSAGWHTLTVRAAGLPVRLDAARVQRSGGLAGPLCEPRARSDEGCGCSASALASPGRQGAPWAALLSLVWILRRRGRGI